MCLFQGAIDARFAFREDNATAHRTLAFEKLLESEDITKMN